MPISGGQIAPAGTTDTEDQPHRFQGPFSVHLDPGPDRTVTPFSPLLHHHKTQDFTEETGILRFAKGLHKNTRIFRFARKDHGSVVFLRTQTIWILKLQEHSPLGLKISSQVCVYLF